MYRDYVVYQHVAPNGKKYVGITHQNIHQRWRNGIGYKNQTRFFNAIQKYGWDNFKHEILLRNLTKEEACWAEEVFIACWNLMDRKYGYNCTNGGIVPKKFAKDCKSKSGIKRQGRTQSKAVKQYLSSFWSNKPRTPNQRCTKKVEQYNKNTGELIQTFDSLTQASRETHVNCGRISSCCHGRCKQAGGFVWKLSNQEKTQIKPITLFGENTPVVQIDFDTNKILNIFPSIKIASETTDIKSSGIINCCRQRQYSAGGYKWRYATLAEVEKLKK